MSNDCKGRTSNHSVRDKRYMCSSRGVRSKTPQELRSDESSGVECAHLVYESCDCEVPAKLSDPSGSRCASSNKAVKKFRSHVDLHHHASAASTTAEECADLVYESQCSEVPPKLPDASASRNDTMDKAVKKLGRMWICMVLLPRCTMALISLLVNCLVNPMSLCIWMMPKLEVVVQTARKIKQKRHPNKPTKLNPRTGLSAPLRTK